MHEQELRQHRCCFTGHRPEKLNISEEQLCVRLGQEIDQAIEDGFIFGMVTNSRSVGGFKGIIGPEIVFDDGVFEVTLIKTPKNAIELNELLGAIVMKQLDSKRMYSFKTGEIKFESEEEIPWTLDGEFGGAHKEITVKDKKQAVQIKVDSEVAAGLSVDSEKVKK